MDRLLSFLLSLSMLPVLTSTAQELRAYRLFDGAGKRSDFGRMQKAIAKADVVLFGELHNSSIAHWLQLETAKYQVPLRGMVMGAEMVEADDQAALDRYLKGEIDAKALDTLVRLWNNHATDYAPLVNLAKDKGVPFVATNVPRRYASMVYKKGLTALDTLPDADKAWMAPLPIAYDPELKGYKDMLSMMGGHGGDNLPKAQALKDATMAHFILRNRKDGQLFLHFNGAYHSDRQEGIVWYLRQARPELRIVTISTVQQADVSKLEAEHRGKADFILCVDEDVPGSY